MSNVIEMTPGNSSKAAFHGTGVAFEVLDKLPFNVMYCGTDLVINYVNPRSMESLKTIEKFLPVPADKVIGSKIDVFHKNPSHQQKILSDARNLPIHTNIKLGPETLNLNVVAVHDNGIYVGAMVTWEVVTEKLVADNKNAQFSSMLENMPTNVLLSDMDLNIVYVNPKSLATLKTIEHLLPCKAHEVLGKNIDFFHKDPSYQRKILSKKDLIES